MSYFRIVNIIKGWFLYLFYPKSMMAKKRLLLCHACKLRKGYFCGVCGCVLVAKAELEEEHCPHPEGDLWKMIK